MAIRLNRKTFNRVNRILTYAQDAMTVIPDQADELQVLILKGMADDLRQAAHELDSLTEGHRYP